MRLTETFKIAVIAVSTNKIRTTLTMLGVVIGVAAVILLISIGRGVENYITDQFEALGSNLLFVTPGRVDVSGDPNQYLSRNKLDEKHLKIIIRDAVGSYEAVSATIQIGGTTEYKTKNYYTSIIATDENSSTVFSYELDTGRFLSRDDVKSKARVAVIGAEVKKELFGVMNPLGKRIKISGDSYEIIGTFKEKGKNFDDNVIVPYPSAMNTFGSKNFSSIVIKARSDVPIDQSIKIIEKALLKDLDKDDFSVLSQKDILSSIQNVLKILTLGLGAIAGISLVVGGIGIMNIMLVSVTERTREIGLRKALGATPSDVASQFLFESMLLSIGGGIIGILFGWLLSLVARNFLRTEVPWWSILLAFSFAAFVGIIFGTYPAAKASQKDPIEALRYE